MNIHIDAFVERLKENIQQPPGPKAQYKMAPEFRMSPKETKHFHDSAKLGAVLILFYPHGEQITTVLIQRPVYRGVHSGQVAFPGGAKEEQDETLIATAIREAEEEVNIQEEDVEVVGELTELYIPPSNFLITPVVSFSRQRPDFVPDGVEVVEVIEVEVDQLLNEKIIKKKKIEVRENVGLEAPYFDIQGKVVWGATAMMLSELTELLRKTF